MTTSDTSMPVETASKPIASARHTIIILVALILVAFRGVRIKPGMNPADTSARLQIYATIMLSEWVLVWGVWRGIRARGITLSELAGGRWKSASDFAMDVLYAAVFWFALFPVLHVWDSVFPAGPMQPAVKWLLPHNTTELLVWIAVSITAGIAEEIVFRGYLQRQFTAWSKHAAIGIILQALVFGMTHVYQGIAPALRITLLGLLFGGLAYWRKSLRPGMIAHASTDILGGLIG